VLNDDDLKKFWDAGLEPVVVPQWKKVPPAGWPAMATSDRQQIANWIADSATTGWDTWGLLTSKSGLLVLDLDMKNGVNGKDGFLELEKVFGVRMSPTWIEKTPSGGYHLYFLQTDPPINSFSAFPSVTTGGVKGVEVIANGGGHGTKITLYGIETCRMPLPLALPEAVATWLKEQTRKAKLKKVREPNPNGDALAKAFEKYNAENPIDIRKRDRTCPFCEHSDCFGLIPGSESFWSCFSADHNGPGRQKDTCWTGDAVDFNAWHDDSDYESSPKQRIQWLVQEGYWTNPNQQDDEDDDE